MRESCLGTPSHLPQKASPKAPCAGAHVGLTPSHAPGSIWGLWDPGVSACSQAGGLPAGDVVLGPHCPPPSLAAGAYAAPGPGLRGAVLSAGGGPGSAAAQRETGDRSRIHVRVWHDP